MMKKRSLKLIVITQLLYIYSGYTNASCTQNPNFMNIQSYLPNKTYNILYSDSSVSTLDVFTINYGSPSYPTAEGANATCQAPNIVARYLWTGFSALEFAEVPTNIPGIAIGIKTANFGYLSKRRGSISNAESFIEETDWIVEIKKTGKVTQSGSLRSGGLADLFFQQSNPSRIFTLTTLSINPNSINFNLIGCSLKNNKNNYDINMGDWYDMQFKNINDTQGTTAIPIALSCLSGTNIKVTVTSDNIDNAANGQLGLTGADKATGIAVQLLNNSGTPIVLNQQFTQQDGVTQTDYIFGWKARYIKTAATVTPGTANANATVNIRYE